MLHKKVFQPVGIQKKSKHIILILNLMSVVEDLADQLFFLHPVNGLRWDDESQHVNHPKPSKLDPAQRCWSVLSRDTGL